MTRRTSNNLPSRAFLGGQLPLAVGTIKKKFHLFPSFFDWTQFSRQSRGGPANLS
jgi:hypothetical protein